MTGCPLLSDFISAVESCAVVRLLGAMGATTTKDVLQAKLYYAAIFRYSYPLMSRLPTVDALAVLEHQGMPSQNHQH